MVPMTPKRQAKQAAPPTVEVDDADREWISPEVAAIVLERAKDDPECWVDWADVKVELAEMDRLGT